MRQLTATDARDMAAIHAESFQRPWDALEMATHTQRDLCLGLDYKGGLAAFIIVSTPADQAEILTITTANAARRQGLAQKLLDAVIENLQAADTKELFLEVAEDNMGALALYKTAGFQPIGRRPGYYRREAGRVAAITFSKKV
jgi:ribosomal-protein-alanine N-acetyltransferase